MAKQSAKWLFPTDFINQIICGDCLDVMKQIPDESIDLIITSPPYNLRCTTGKNIKKVIVAAGEILKF